MINSNTWNSLTVCLKWIIGIIWQYLETFNCVQMNGVELDLTGITGNRFTACKQMINIEKNYLCKVAIIKTIWLCWNNSYTSVQTN